MQKRKNRAMNLMAALAAAAASAPGQLMDAMMKMAAPKPHRHATTPKWVQEQLMNKAEAKRARKAAKRYTTDGKFPTMATLSSNELRSRDLPRLLTKAEKRRVWMNTPEVPVT